ncbi:cysteine-rich secretory protein LCCL domain-containing 2 isoform X2 [Fukomys damarensis]|uniref:cysteine-rich secretory protein LCCL domain-containing 2 isoform X2 n=1 Tax=Fukomys damarensis TaxID=885580 RepID=UPI00054009DD|nr:cysteine-rich secretory protein LCCL domain-containing 2 isoform X2 [Fukomys damarensis]
MSCIPSGIVPLGLALLVCGAQGFLLPNVTELGELLGRYQQAEPRTRVRRAIPREDREEILRLHNQLRGQVSPPASNMEHVTWDEELERSAAAWAQECIWEHGPTSLLTSIGQNLAVHWGRYRSPGFHVQSWYDEVKDYTYPYPHECSPWCPERCSGAMCTHYTQIVWATTTKVGCAVHTCRKIDVWGEIWENAVYLVCNYSPKGNWIGEAPYRTGRPCSECPPSYGGGCRNNLCYRGPAACPEPVLHLGAAQGGRQPKRGMAGQGPVSHTAERPCRTVGRGLCPDLPRLPEAHHPTSETDEMNEVEKPPVTEEKHVWVQPRVVRPTKPQKSPTVTYMTQIVQCDTKMKDRCQGSTCNRYQCPAGCLSSKASVFGTVFYESSSSICRAAIHFGILDDGGGLVDVTRKGRKPFFVKSQRHGVESLSKYKPSSSFMVSKVKEQDLDCYTTVAQLCPFEKPVSHCPRVRCPASCGDEPDYWAPVIGTNIYADTSSICRAAVHAGAIQDDSGGSVDVMPVDKKRSYTGSLRNGVQSESLSAARDGKAFRIFAVRQ